MGMPVPMLMLPLSVAAMLPAIVFPSVARRSRRPAACHPDMPHVIPVPVARNPKRIGEGKRRAHFFDRRRRRCFNDLRAARRRRRLVHRARIRRISGPPVALVEKPNASPVLPRRWLPDIPRCRRQGPMSLCPDLPARMPCPIACDPLMTEGWRLGHHFQSVISNPTLPPKRYMYLPALNKDDGVAHSIRNVRHTPSVSVLAHDEVDAI